MAEQNLTNFKIKDSYEGLLHLDGELSTGSGPTNTKPVFDGLGQSTSLSISKDYLKVNGNCGVSGNVGINGGAGAQLAIKGNGSTKWGDIAITSNDSDWGFIDQGTQGQGIGLRGYGFQDGTLECDLYVDGNGNVGIGTEIPGSMLEVKGNGTTKYGSIEIDTNGDGGAGFVDQGVDGRGIGLRGEGSQNGTKVCDLYVENGGKVGIGTETPQKKLHIVGQMRYQYGTPAVGQVLTCTNTSGNVAWQDSSSVESGAGNAPYYGCRAWARFTGSNNTLIASGNITFNRQDGGYWFDFVTPMPTNNYAVVTGSTVSGQYGSSYICVPDVTNQTKTGFRIKFHGGGPKGGDNQSNNIHLAVFG